MEHSNSYWREKKKGNKRERERGVEKKTQDSVKSSVVDLLKLRVVSRTAKQIATYHVTKFFNALYVEYGGR